MSSGERKVGEAQSDKKTNDSLTSDQLGASANFVFLCLSPTGLFCCCFFFFDSVLWHISRAYGYY